MQRKLYISNSKQLATEPVYKIFKAVLVAFEVAWSWGFSDFA